MDSPQRYEPEIFREDRIRMEPDQCGDWVKFEDYQQKMAEAQQLIEGPFGTLNQQGIKMDERFLELAKTLPGWTSSDDGGYIGPHSSALKLYTKLIVRECYLWTKENGGLSTDVDYSAIKEHFGIEQ